MPIMGINNSSQKLSDNLASTLFSATQQRVLGALFGQPDRSFYTTELIVASGGGSGAVQRELMQLEASGLVASHRVGNQKHYQANPQSPIFEELRGIVQKTIIAACTTLATSGRPAGTAKTANTVRSRNNAGRALRRLNVSRAQVAVLARRYKLQRFSFFGSVTRDDFKPGSDVDVLVEFSPKHSLSLNEMAALRGEISTLAGGRKVDLATPAILRNPHRRKTIERDLELVYAAG